MRQNSTGGSHKKNAAVYKRELAFAVYQFGVGKLKGSRQALGNVDGHDVYDEFCTAIKEQEEVFVKRKNEEYITIASCHDDSKERYIWGVLQSGANGERRRIVDTSDSSAPKVSTKVIEATEAAMESFFYCVFVPKDIQGGFIMLQQRGNICNAGYFLQVLESQLRGHELSLRHNRVAPPDFAETIKKSSISKITITRRVDSKTKLGGLEKFGDLDEAGKVTILIEPRQDGALESFRKLLNSVAERRKKGMQMTDLLDFDAERVTFKMVWNGREMSVLSDVEAAGRPSYLKEIGFDTNGPLIGEMKQFAKDMFEAAYDI